MVEQGGQLLIRRNNCDWNLLCQIIDHETIKFTYTCKEGIKLTAA